MNIKTTYIPATNTSGSKIRATAKGYGSLTIPYSSHVVDPHGDVARKLAVALGVNRDVIMTLQSETGYTFIA